MAKLNVPTLDDTFMIGKLSGLPYLRRNNELYCWYPGASKWHKSLNNTLVTFVSESSDYFQVRDLFPSSINSTLPT